ncbi:hypothetical protein W97_06698 [Coniosporium apollinis CBS 100218]|uniref:Uncharacterized protein n=1 Tax=Coniosporium apollinis (strain CBS 100218) TaxID=1168221 RepID=R7Z071_CONA1|nr:uncharacterized protein W97_06698 [Coniosporium apollinis CBS 100218]EON67444.1 hypothetical protein W97_06698 [Coniosporium apollinis CBS 100218]
MSATSNPIPPERFALALTELPLGSLHAKAAELRNSIAHLRHSNEQLTPYARDGDRECADAIRENEEVISRMEERVALLKAEVEGRGMPWVEVEEEKKGHGNREGGERAANGEVGERGSSVDGDGAEEEGVHL